VDADLTSHHIEGFAREGGMRHFSVPLISHIAGNLYVGGCIHGVPLPFEIKHVVSLYKGERYKQHDDVRSWHVVQMLDSRDTVDEPLVWTLATLVNQLCALAPTLVHCQAGLNRSNLIAACALILHGHTPDAAITLLRERRCDAVLCNPVFEEFVRTSPIANNYVRRAA